MTEPSIQQRKTPEGWTKIGSNGLVIPRNFANNGALNSNNQTLLGLRDKLDVKSLRLSIMDSYINTIRQKNGVIRYDGEFDPENFASTIMDNLSYHVHGRHFTGLLKKMKDFEKGRKNWVEPLRSWILDTKQANFLTKSDDFNDIKVFVQKVGTNHSVRDKSARFGASPPSEMLFAYATKSPFSHSLLPAAKAKNFRTLDKVAFCAVLMSFARTYFEHQSRSD